MSDTRVYFIKSARSNAVKIGVADNVKTRMRALQNATPDRLILLAEMPGDERYERQLHVLFAEYRIRGEWFRCEGKLAVFIAALPAMPSPEAQRPKARARLAMPAIDPIVAARVDRDLAIISAAAERRDLSPEEVAINQAAKSQLARLRAGAIRVLGIESGAALLREFDDEIEREELARSVALIRAIGVGDQLVEEALKTP